MTVPAEGAEFVFRDRLVVEPIGEEGLLIDLETGNYFRLNGTATQTCVALQQSASIAEAVAQLTGQFGFPSEQARALVEGVREQLTTSGRPAAAERWFAYRRHDAGYALEENGTPILTTDVQGRQLRLIVPLETLRFDVGQYVRAMTPKVLQLRGMTAMHASACELPEGLTAFSGESGAGKTTTAKAIAATRRELVSEDLLVFARGAADTLVVADGERQAYGWAQTAARSLSADPGARIDCEVLDSVADGKTRLLEAIWFIDRGRRDGSEIIKQPLSKIDGVLALLGNNFLGGGDADSCRRHARETHRIARAVSLWRTTMPSGLEALAAAARGYAANSAS